MPGQLFEDRVGDRSFPLAPFTLMNFLLGFYHKTRSQIRFLLLSQSKFLFLWQSLRAFGTGWRMPIAAQWVTGMAQDLAIAPHQKSAI